MSDGPTLGLLVPCRNEAAVLGRKLANLAQQRWPAASRPHRLIVIDDQSDDGTAAVAVSILKRGVLGDDVWPEVIRNDGRPGKASALAAGLARLSDSVDVVLLSDADVVFDDDALLAVAAALASPDGPGMVCGSQRFVASLAEDGSPGAKGGGPLVPAGGLYDRWTAAVRALESRGGRLFSVHGQLLAWRSDLGIAPTPGIAADDLDLMRQVRAAGRAVVKLDDARFFELKTPPGDDRADQQLRRARAFFQVIGRCRLPAGTALLDRVHFGLYRTLPAVAPVAAWLGLLLLPGIGLAWLGPPGLAGGMALAALTRYSPVGRRLAQLLSVVAASRKAEAAGALPDRWEMPRR